MNVPFLDLRAHHSPYLEEFLAAIREVMESGAFAGGPYVTAFELAFAAFCQTGYCAGVGSGTEALWLALRACGIGSGDEVITTPCTFIATAEAISLCGARPVFVDVDAATYTMDPVLIEAAVTPRTKALIPVHLFGQAADMDPILGIARKHGLAVVEDACQAHGAAYKGRPAGSLGDAGCFSFYPGKNIGAFGEAGALTTDRPELAQQARALADHGQRVKYFHQEIGWNCRMDGIQAAILKLKLARLPADNERRRAHAALYRELLGGVEEITLPAEADYATHVYHVYAPRVPAREAVLRHLAAAGIGCGIHYPVPVHLQEAYRRLGHQPGDFPVAERAAAEFLSLPMYPELTPEQIRLVAHELKQAVRAQ
jgi:dTDP-4-amino-4,6-dideoxygalactose transaminase